MTSEDVASTMSEKLKEIQGSLCIFGDWFGRPMDNVHQAVSFDCDDGYLRIEFKQGETLEVWNPRGVRKEDQRFVIDSADKVRWEWFYYGRPQTPENRFREEHVVEGKKITATSNVDCSTRTFSPSFNEPAVSIV